MGVALLAVVAVLIGVSLTRRSTNELISTPDDVVETSARTLAEARQLLKQGDIRGAQQKAGEIPLGSAARSSPDFRAIQAAYADHLFDLADKATHPADKRAFYDEIARTPSIDSARRQRANDRLNALGAEAVNIADLPRAVVRAPSPSSSTTQAPRKPAPTSDFGEPDEPRPSKPAATPPAEKPKSSEPTTLVERTRSTHLSATQPVPVDRLRAFGKDVLLSRPVLAAAGVLALSGVVELVPGLERVRLWSARSGAEAAEPKAEVALAPSAFGTGEAEIRTESHGDGRVPDGTGAARGPIAAQPGAGVPDFLDKEPKVPIVDPSGTALDGFFRALERTRLKQTGAITRIAHFGDSIVVGDYVSSTLRRRMQEKFGDSGHGYMLIANAWPAYSHADVERYATVGWNVSRIVGPLAPDGMYGLGCVSFSADKNALARFGTASGGDYGRAVSRFSISYLAQPNGGAFQVSLDGKPERVIDTTGPEKRVQVAQVDVPDGPHQLEIQTQRGRSRLFGVVMERDRPGVVLDALGIQGARLRFPGPAGRCALGGAAPVASPGPRRLSVRRQRERRRLPVSDGRLPAHDGGGDRAGQEGVARVELSGDRRHGSGCQARRRADRHRGDPEHLERAARRRRAHGLRLLRHLRGDGRPGSMAIWVRRQLGQADLTHPTAVGADVIGTWVFRALMKRYRERIETGALVAPPSNSAPTSSSPSR